MAIDISYRNKIRLMVPVTNSGNTKRNFGVGVSLIDSSSNWWSLWNGSSEDNNTGPFAAINSSIAMPGGGLDNISINPGQTRYQRFEVIIPTTIKPGYCSLISRVYKETAFPVTSAYTILDDTGLLSNIINLKTSPSTAGYTISNTYPSYVGLSPTSNGWTITKPDGTKYVVYEFHVNNWYMQIAYVHPIGFTNVFWAGVYNYQIGNMNGQTTETLKAQILSKSNPFQDGEFIRYESWDELGYSVTKGFSLITGEDIYW